MCVPRARPHPRAKAQRSRFGERAALDVGEQDRGRFIFADEVAAKDMAVARPVLERDTPLPAGLVRARLCIGTRWAGILARHRDRTVARSEDGRVGKEGVGTWRLRWTEEHKK